MKRYTYYLFDIDRTLWDFDKNAQNAIHYTLDRYGLCERLGITDKKDFFEKYETVNQELWRRYESGEITKEKLRNERFYQTFKQFYGLDDRELADGFGEAYLDRMPLETALVPGAGQVLEELKRRGCKIAAVSNGFKEVQYRKLENSGIRPYIDAVLISEEVGFHKPSPVIFKKALEQLLIKETDRNFSDGNKPGNGSGNEPGSEAGHEPWITPPDKTAPPAAGNSNTPSRIRPVVTPAVKRETLMVGDDFTNDMEGAQIYGIDQFYYNPYHYPCEGGPTYEGDNLLELIKN